MKSPFTLIGLPITLVMFVFLACKTISPTTTKPEPEHRHGMAGYWMQQDRLSRAVVPVAARVSNDSLVPSAVCCLVNGMLVDSLSWSTCVRLNTQELVDAYVDSIWRPHVVGPYLVVEGESYRLDSLRKTKTYRKWTDAQWQEFLQALRDGKVQ